MRPQIEFPMFQVNSVKRINQDSRFERLKSDYPILYNKIDIERYKSLGWVKVIRNTYSRHDFDSGVGRGEKYLEAQTNPLIRKKGINRLFELICHGMPMHKCAGDFIIADVLGGDGVLARAIPSLILNPQHRPFVLTSDISEDMVLAAESQGLPAIRQPAQSLLLKNNSVDGIIIAYGSHHILGSDRQLMCDEAFRVLQPNGRVVLHDYDPNSPVARWFEEIVNKYSTTGHMFPHFSQEEIEAKLRDAGFINIQVERMYDPFEIPVPVHYKDALEFNDIAEVVGQYLTNMYGLSGITKKRVFKKANALFRYNSNDADNCDPAPCIRVLQEKEKNIIVLPRVAIVGHATKPAPK